MGQSMITIDRRKEWVRETMLVAGNRSVSSDLFLFLVASFYFLGFGFFLRRSHHPWNKKQFHIRTKAKFIIAVCRPRRFVSWWMQSFSSISNAHAYLEKRKRVFFPAHNQLVELSLTASFAFQASHTFLAPFSSHRCSVEDARSRRKESEWRHVQTKAERRNENADHHDDDNVDCLLPCTQTILIGAPSGSFPLRLDTTHQCTLIFEKIFSRFPKKILIDFRSTKCEKSNDAWWDDLNHLQWCLCSRLPISFIQSRQIRFFVLKEALPNFQLLCCLLSSLFSRSFRGRFPLSLSLYLALLF